MTNKSILIVEDDATTAKIVVDILLREGFDVVVAVDGQSAEQALASRAFSITLLDLALPDTSGTVLLGRWTTAFPETQVIVMTANREIATAVQCVKAGAFDFLVKPLGSALLLKTIKGATQYQVLAKRISILAQLAKRAGETHFADVIAISAAMRHVVATAQRIAAEDSRCVLILGEGGVGKKLLARAIHKMSRRAENPFVEVGNTSLSPELARGELFGLQKGVFAEVREGRIGVFEMAEGGTVFLDELGDMNAEMQASVAQVMEDRHFRRVGGSVDITANMALIATSRQDLARKVETGTFRRDLFYRFGAETLLIPPLRERVADIHALATHFLDLYARQFGKSLIGFSSPAARALDAYPWPGNVRELRNVVERACLLAQKDVIDVSDLLLPVAPGAGAQGGGGARPLQRPVSLAQAEEQAIRSAMAAAQGNRNAAAEILGIHRTTLYKKLREYNLEPAEPPAPAGDADA